MTCRISDKNLPDSKEEATWRIKGTDEISGKIENGPSWSDHRVLQYLNLGSLFALGGYTYKYFKQL